MPYASQAEARDAILALFKSGWDAQGSPVPVVIYDDVKVKTPNPNTEWVEVVVRHTGGAQATLGSVGNRRFRRRGRVVAKIYAVGGEGLKRADALVKIATDIFEGKSTVEDGVLFTNVQSREYGQDGSWFRIDALADFEYDIIK